MDTELGQSLLAHHLAINLLLTFISSIGPPFLDLTLIASISLQVFKRTGAYKSRQPMRIPRDGRCPRFSSPPRFGQQTICRFYNQRRLSQRKSRSRHLASDLVFFLEAPVLTQGAVTTSAYFQARNWFDLLNYSSSITTPKGMFTTLPAPADHCNVHVKDGMVLAMQGEAMTTDAARRTPFNLLMAVDESWKIYGEVFVDDGASVEMGKKGSNWSLVKFYSAKRGYNLDIRSDVINGDFATSQKWVIDKVTILGLMTGTRVKGCRLHIKRETGNLVKATSSSSYVNGEFTIFEIANFTVPLGKEFKLKVKLAKTKKA